VYINILIRLPDDSLSISVLQHLSVDRVAIVFIMVAKMHNLRKTTAAKFTAFDLNRAGGLINIKYNIITHTRMAVADMCFVVIVVTAEKERKRRGDWEIN